MKLIEVLFSIFGKAEDIESESESESVEGRGHSDQKRQAIPKSLERYKVDILEVEDYLSQFEEVVATRIDRFESWVMAFSSIPSSTERYSSKNYRFEVGFKDVNQGYKFELSHWSSGNQYFIKYYLGRLSEASSMQHVYLTDIEKIYEERFPNEIAVYLHGRLAKLDSIISPIVRKLREKRENEKLDAMDPKERQDYIVEKKENERYFALTKIGRETLSDKEAKELFEIKKSQKNRKRRKQRKKRNEAKKAAEELRKKIELIIIDSDRHKYEIANDDYKRGSDKERSYLRAHKATLLRFFDSRCAICGADDKGIDIDHFFFSKNEGGCFTMKHKEGYYINNAIPLCEPCNRSKSDKDYKSLFSEEQLLKVLKVNIEMTKRLNNYEE